uniref:Uncharacterized protein n=1 Tax=Anguilla anguilla TaxID=7936 RepID=A0A0E9XSX2_ANGAN
MASPFSFNSISRGYHKYSYNQLECKSLTSETQL